MLIETFFPDALPPNFTIGYYVTQCMHDLFPGRYVLETQYDLPFLEYGRAGECAITIKQIPAPEIITSWEGLDHEIERTATNAWFEVAWQGHQLEALVLTAGDMTWYFVIAGSREVAERFYLAVRQWDLGVHAEVLVFTGHDWEKDEDLFKAIQGITFESLVLDGTLKEEIQTDIAAFFANRVAYEEHGVPWKRGILFLGPPGNGKTHAVKAVINAVAQPCLYVKALHRHRAIATVFAHARRAAPCVLVFEDLDSLVRKEMRSELLNELDGFAANTGILVLATTNHPKKLDPALIDRPSRFDRKYHFDLPTLGTRHAYIERWNAGLRAALRLPAAAVADTAARTEGFSFAYLKELFVSATMRWMATPVPGAMEMVITEQITLLRAQMPAPKRAGSGEAVPALHAVETR